MKQTITKNFLLVTVLLAVGFAVAMRATSYQKKSLTPPTVNSQSAPEFAAYWFAKKAELTYYTLEQAQDGRLNPGQAILIFVTEDFRPDVQVTSGGESRSVSRDNTIQVMKTNLIKRFQAGMSAYSLETSVFTPINNPLFPNSLKASTSVQNWDGHSYIQLNLRNNAFEVSGQSYVEQEVAENYRITKGWLEDELWTRIRLAPDKLPTGTVSFIPGTMTARLRHKRLDPVDTEAKLEAYTGTQFQGDSLQTYTVDYRTDERKLMIAFEKAFPHRIVGWEETYKHNNKLLTSRAIRQKTIQTDYWNHTTPADSSFLRSQ